MYYKIVQNVFIFNIKFNWYNNQKRAWDFVPLWK